MFAEPRKFILVSKPPNHYPSCWPIPDENETLDPNIPTFDLEQTKMVMNQTAKLCSTHRNVNSEDEEWESKILKYGWLPKQIKVFNEVVKILDYDRLARLANVDNLRFEAVQRRATIDKSAERMRKCMASIAWDTPIVQWLHGLLMEYLPRSYLSAYLEIMQTLKTKVPTKVDKMIFWKPGNINQELLAPILKKPWHPILNNKYRKLPGNALLVVIPSAAPRLAYPHSSRLQKLYTLFTTLAPMLPVQLNINNLAVQKQSLQSIAEQTVSIARTKIQELKAENPDRRLILVGLNSASALALQVAMVEQVSGVVCFGFSYNTVHGVRGQPDDQLLNLTTPTLFLIGQNAARSSEEEIEFLREKFTAPTSTVVVGGADDFLRLSKKKRKYEGVTQEMADNMIVDEIADFATKCLQRPLPAKAKVLLPGKGEINSSTGAIRKRKISGNGDGEGTKSVTVKSQKLMRPTSTSDDMLEMAVQSILPGDDDKAPAPQPTQKIFTSCRIVSVAGQQQRPKFQQLQTKPQTSTVQTKYVTVSGQKGPKAGQKFGQIQQRSVASRSTTPTSQTQILISNRLGAVKPSAAQIQQSNFSPQKFTIVRQTKPSPDITYISETSSADLSNASIFDMPVVFADSEGNIDEEASTMSDGSVISVASDSPPSSISKQIVIKSTPSSYTLTKNKNILIQKPSQTQTKMFTLNGMVIGKQVPSNIVLPKANPQPIKIHKFVPGTKFVKTTAAPTQSGKKIEILNNTIIKPASQTVLSRSASFVNLADAKTLTGSRLSFPILSNSTKVAPQQIVIKSNSLKPYTGSQIVPSTIGSNKQLGNLTVKRLNVVSGSTISKIVKKD